MPRRAASITQADIARAIRAAKAAGWPMVRIVTADGATIEIAAGEAAPPIKRRPVL